MHTMQIFNDIKDVSHSLKVFLRKLETLGLADFLLKNPRGHRKLQYLSISFRCLSLSRLHETELNMAGKTPRRKCGN